MPFKIEINKLGPVRDSEIGFSPFLIFTGPSNTGKSYVAFLVFSFIKLIAEKTEELTNFLQPKIKIYDDAMQRDNKVEVIIKMSEFNIWLKDYICKYVGYLIGDDKFKCDFNFVFKKDTISYTIEKEMIDLKGRPTLNQYSVKEYEIVVHGNSIPHALILNTVLTRELFNRQFILGTYILPPARAAIMGFNFTEKNQVSKTGMYKDFITDLDITESADYRRLYGLKKDNFIFNEITSIIQGNLSFKNGEYFYSHNDITIPMTAASSAIKEISPLVRVLEKLPTANISFLIEEPEAHLHPFMQRRISDILSYIVTKGGFIQITTHSDYLLSRISNLVKLHIINKSKKLDKEKIDSLYKNININKSYSLSADRLRVYNFVKNINGTVNINNLDLKKSIPFDSFKSTIEEMINETNIIDNLINEYGLA